MWREKTTGSAAEEMEREAKGDLSHNPPLNFTRNRFTKDPRAGPTSRALPHTFYKLRTYLCVFYLCVCHTEVKSSGKMQCIACNLESQVQRLTNSNILHTVLTEISSITKMKTKKQIYRLSAGGCICWSSSPFRASEGKQLRKCNRKNTHTGKD